MWNYKIIFLISLVIFSCSKTENKNTIPNIVFILADDLGYGEIGILGQKKIETPNIDQLAKNGMILTDHYTGSPVCAPSRSILLTGLHSGNNPIRGNDEWKERGDVWSFEAMFENPELEGQRPLPDSIITLADILKSKGYKTGMFGKWGLGAPNTNGAPKPHLPNIPVLNGLIIIKRNLEMRSHILADPGIIQTNIQKLLMQQ